MLARPGRPFTTLFVCLLVAIAVRPFLAYNRTGHVIFATQLYLAVLVAVLVGMRVAQGFLRHADQHQQ